MEPTQGAAQQPTTHQQPDLSGADFDAAHRDAYLYSNGIIYDSKSEKACAILMEKYVPGWKPIDGITVHVPLGFGKIGDFLVKGHLLEFHPCNLKWTFINDEAYHQFLVGLSDCSARAKINIRDGLIHEFELRYQKERRFAMDHSTNPDIRAAHLFCAHSNIDFIRFLIKLTHRKDLDEGKLAQEFFRAIKSK